MRGAGEVNTGDLQVASVDVALVQRYVTVGGDLLCGAAAHVVVLAVDGRAAAAVYLREVDGTVFGVVGNRPDAGARLYPGLVAVGIVVRDEVREVIHREHGVLVEIIGLIICAACHAGAVYDSGGAVADVVVIVGISGAVHLGAGQLTAGVVAEGICHRGVVARGGASERASGRIVSVAAVGNACVAAAVEHAGEQLALRFVVLREVMLLDCVST